MKLSRLQETIIYILDRASQKEIKGLSKFQIMKLLYLIQVESQKYIGEPFVNDLQFYREERGPISIQIYHAIEPLKDIYLKITTIPNFTYGHVREDHTLIKKNIKYKFRNEEIIFLNSILDDYLSVTQAKLGKIVYETEPMKDILKIEEQKGSQKGAPLDMNKIRLDEDVLQVISA